MKEELNHIDFFYAQLKKHGENVPGDVMHYKHIQHEDRFIGVLSDGLGSGLKANIQASLTASMAMKFMESNRDILDFADIMISSLPVCKVRNLSYATFSLIEIVKGRHVKIAEMGNPQFMLFRNDRKRDVKPKYYTSVKWHQREIALYDFNIQLGDRMILFSDGISQSGLNAEYDCSDNITGILSDKPEIESSLLAKKIINRARLNEPAGKVHDDMTCAVFHFRESKKLLVVTGPPFYNSDDTHFAERVKNYQGSKIVCGGVTAKILSRELNLSMSIDLESSCEAYPPVYSMKEFEMVTEGAIMLTEAASVLKKSSYGVKNHSVKIFANKLREFDEIDFLVGTKVNEAHLAPSFPLEMDLRRNIVRELAEVLKVKYLKKVNINYI